jgi:hypothetical protein
MQEDDDTIAVGLNYDPSNGSWYGVQLIYRPTVQAVFGLERTGPE